MKNHSFILKTVPVLIALTFMCTAAYAQTSRYGVTASLLRTSAKDMKALTGFSAGVRGQWLMADKESNGAYLDASLMLTMRGWKDEVWVDFDGTRTTDWKCHLYYLEMPLHVGYRQVVSDNLAMTVSAGPYIGVGLWGNTSFDDVEDDNIPENSNDVFADGIYRRLDIGAGVDIGIEHKHFLLSVGYEMGFIKPLKEWKVFDGHNRAWRVSLSYMF